MRRETFTTRVPQRVFEHRVELDRLAEARGFLRFMAHVAVFADQSIRRARRLAPLQFDALLARARLCVAALGTGDDDDLVASRLDVERTLIDRRLHVVAAERRQYRLGTGRADRFRDDPRRVLVRPDAADDAHRRRPRQQLVRACVGRRRAHGVDHQVQRFSRVRRIGAALLELTDADEHRHRLFVVHDCVYLHDGSWLAMIWTTPTI